MFGKATKFHSTTLVEAEIIASELPATMPTTSDGIENLGDGYTLAPGSTMIVTGADKQYILGDDGTWEEYSAGGGGASIQVTSLPTASASLVGTIYQYVGTMGPSLGIIHGHFYECVEGSTSGTYEWRDVSNFIPVIDNSDDVLGKVVDGTIFYYTGTTTAALTTGCLYKALISETSPGIYAYGYQPVIPMQMDSTPTENSANPVTSGGVYDAIQSAGGGGYFGTVLFEGSLTRDGNTATITDADKYDGLIIGVSSAKDDVYSGMWCFNYTTLTRLNYLKNTMNKTPKLYCFGSSGADVGHTEITAVTSDSFTVTDAATSSSASNAENIIVWGVNNHTIS